MKMQAFLKGGSLHASSRCIPGEGVCPSPIHRTPVSPQLASPLTACATSCAPSTSNPAVSSSISNTGRKPSQNSLRSGSRRSIIVAAADSPAQEEVVKLSSLQSSPFIDEQGLINPTVPGSGNQVFKAFVFAVYDAQMKIQYTGFSTDLRNTLRTLIGRRPDKAHYYKVVGLPELNQERMLQIRNAWYEQLGGAPIGNKLALERNMWQNPVDAGAISARGKRGAAEEQCRQLQDQLRLMGCTEEFTPNEDMLNDGMVDFLPVGGISEATSNALKASQQEAKKRTRKAKATVDGVDQTFEVRYDSIMKTNGGYIVDLAVNIDNRSTRHRVVVGEHYVQGQGLSSPEAAIESAMAALLEAKLPRQTEGLISMGTFPMNYFSVSGAEQWFPEEFARAFQWNAGKPYKEDTDKMWRFTRSRSYGAAFVEEQERMKREAEEEEIKAERMEEQRIKAEEEARENAEYAKNAV